LLFQLATSRCVENLCHGCISGIPLAFSSASRGHGNLPRPEKETEWIDEGDGTTTSVCIGIDTAVQPDRITLNIPTDSRIEVSEPVLMQPGLPIEDLTGQTQVVGNY
jgi:hypothetical protein